MHWKTRTLLFVGTLPILLIEVLTVPMVGEKDKERQGQFRSYCVQRLHDTGHRVTKARLAVIDCLSSSSQPLSASDIFSRLSQENTGSESPDKVSVYRVLDTLASLHLVHRISPSGEYLACEHFHCDHGHHIIYRCEQCGAAEERDLPIELVAPLLNYSRQVHHFSPDAHLIHMDGLCKKCVSSQKKR